MITVSDVSKSYLGRAVLDRVSLRVSSETTHVLLGSSGSGKSTLLRILLGLESPDSGHVEIDGQTAVVGDRERLRRVGYVPQEGGLFPHMTALDNVTLVARVERWPKEKIRSRVDELRLVVGLDPELLARFPKELSGGQSQRVAMMRAAFLDPSVMILDEPLGALDPIIRSDLQEELKVLFVRLRKTVVLVTHDLGEAAFFGDAITLLHEGRVVQTGTLRDLMTRPASPFVTQFIRAERTVAIETEGLAR